MRIIIVGGGKVGATIAGQLTKEGHDITVIDKSGFTSSRISDALDVMALCGNGASADVLREAGAAQSDLLIACTGQDELNIICCMFAKQLGCKNTIARVRDPEYAENIYMLKDAMGLSLIVNPEYYAAQEMFKLIEIPGVFKRDAFAEGRIEIVEIVPKEGSVLDGTQLSDFIKVTKCQLLVCAVQRGDSVRIPDGSFTLRAGDKVYICGPADGIVRLLRNIGLHSRQARSVLLIGGSRLSEYLTLMLQKIGAQIKLVEIDPVKAKALAERLPGVDVLCGDGSAEDFLCAEGVEGMDAAVTLTNIDEENLLLSMYLRSLGVNQVITKVNRTEFVQLLAEHGVDRVVSPKNLCANAIIRYVRAMQNTEGSSVLTIHHLVDGKVEAQEFAVTHATRNLGKTLMELQLKPDILVSCINRKGKIIVPRGSDRLEEGDTVVIVTSSQRILLDLNDIFAEEV